MSVIIHLQLRYLISKMKHHQYVSIWGLTMISVVHLKDVKQHWPLFRGLNYLLPIICSLELSDFSLKPIALRLDG